MFFAKLTPVGEAKFAAANAGGPNVNLTAMAVGDGAGNPVGEPSGTETALVREVYRDQISAVYVNPVNLSIFRAEMAIPSPVGGWSIREVGIYDADGDLLAYGNFAETYKPVASEGMTRDMVIEIHVRVANASTINLVIDTSIVLASRAWVLSHINRAHILPGGLTRQILSKASNTDGDTEWIDISEGIQVLVGIIDEVQTLSAAQTVVNFSLVSTSGLAVFIDGHRLIQGHDYAVTGLTQITLSESHDAGSRLHCYQNDPMEAPEYLRPGLNLSDLTNKKAARATLGVPSKTTSYFMGQN